MNRCIYIFGLLLCVGFLGCHHRVPGHVVVQKGDTAYRIAERYGVTVEELASLNQLSDPSKLDEGQELVIPGFENQSEFQHMAKVESKSNTQDTELETPLALHPSKKNAPNIPKEAWDSPGSWSALVPGADNAVEQRLEFKKFKRCVDVPKELYVNHRVSMNKNDGVQGQKDMFFDWPLDGVITTAFGMLNGLRHDGVDIAAPEGSIAYAAAQGKVIFSGQQGSYGNLVIIKHNAEWVSVYAHNLENCVKAGDEISLGGLVALVGQTGQAESSYLHFELRKNAIPVAPKFKEPNG